MSFVHGSSTQVLVNDRLVSTEVSGWTTSHARAMSEVTTAGQVAGAAGAKFIPGLTSGTLALRGPQDSDPETGLYKEIRDAVGVDNAFLATCLPDGHAIGKPAIFGVIDPLEHTIDAAVADAVGFAMNGQADEGIDMGYVIHALSAETADGNGTAVDRGAAPLTPTAHGLMAGIHVTAYATLTSAVIKIQHSADNSVWADLVTFATVTGTGWEQIKIADGTTVNRYLRVTVDVTGSGSVTFLVAAAPR